MKLNLLSEKITIIQREYCELLEKLLPKLKDGYAVEALDEINIFWYRYIDTVQLYLKSIQDNEECYVFTAATYLDYEDKEHFPFLLLGERHILDDPLSKYSAICKDIRKNKNAPNLYEQIYKTAEDNIKIINNCGGEIIVLPLRLFNQFVETKDFFDIGEKAFVSLFNGIDSIKDFFSKCKNIDDIIQYARENIANLVLFSEKDDLSKNFKERFKIAVSYNKEHLGGSKSDAYYFFMLVYGYIQQAIDVICSCVEYRCFPFVRFTVAYYYIIILSHQLKDVEFIGMMRYKMSVAHALYMLFDKDKIARIDTKEFVSKVKKNNFSNKIFSCLRENGFITNDLLPNTAKDLLLSKLDALYMDLTN